MDTAPATVLGLFSQPLVSEGLARVLEGCADLSFLGSGTDPGDFSVRAEELRPSVVVLDHAFGLRSIGELVRALRAGLGSGKALLWSRNAQAVDWRMLRECGLDGVVDQSAGPAAVVEALRAACVTGDGANDGGGELRFSRLTPREREILSLVEAGLRNREIAERMAISAGTVKVHLKHIFEKTGARGRAALPRLVQTPVIDGMEAERT